MELSNENVIHRKNEKTEYIQFRKLLEYQDTITHAFSLGKEVNYRTVIRTETGEINRMNYNKALHDYENLCTSLELDKNDIIRPSQTHKDQVKIAQRKIQQGKPDIYLDEYAETDGLITQKKNLILATTSADCILMLFFDPKTKTIANVHSGWKGTYKQIVINTVEKMKSECNVKPENLICCMCPSIRQCHFEVRKDVKDMFAEKFKRLKEIDTIIKKKQNDEEEKWNIDTIELNRIMLQKQGLKPENIIDSKICTVCSSDIIHSYRVEKAGFGLETAIITLK